MSGQIDGCIPPCPAIGYFTARDVRNLEINVRDQRPSCIPRNRKHDAATAALACTLWFAASTHSAFGQTTDPAIPTEPVHTAIPIHLDATSGNIKVGNKTYAGANNAMHLLALKRQPQADPNQQDTAAVIMDQVVTDGGSAQTFLQTALANTSDALVIANGVGSYNFQVSAIAANLLAYGGQVDLGGAGSGSFIFIGNGTLNKGGAFQRGGSTVNIDGYLALDSNSNYKFIQTDYVRYDINPANGTITIGGAAYTAAASVNSCTGGDTSNSFRLVVVDRETLALSANNSYCTTQAGQFDSLKNDLGSLNSESQLVFIGTNGRPIPSGWTMSGSTIPLGAPIVNLGGYAETILYLTPNDTYSLVGAPPPPSFVNRPRSRSRESSTVYPGHPSGELHGVLARGRGNWYSPVNADTSGRANLDFYDKVMAQVPVPAGGSTIPNPNYTFPPYTTDSNYADKLSAFTSISNQICLAASGGNPIVDCSKFNVRNTYANTNIAISNYQFNLQNIKGPGGVDCSQLANSALVFCQVWRQISLELQYVQNTRNFQANLGTLGTIEGEDSLFDLINTWQTVQATLPTPPSSATAPSLVSPIVNLVLGVAGSAPTPLAPLFGLVDAFFNLGMSLTTDTSGNQAVSLSAPVAALADQAQDDFHAQLDTVGVQFDLIYENWPRLSALGALLGSGQPGWSWGDPTATASEISARLNPAIKQAMYRSLMSAVYAIGSYVPNTNVNCSGNGSWPVWGTPNSSTAPFATQPNAYGVNDGDFQPCHGAATQVVQPFNSLTSPPAYVPYTYPTDPFNLYANNPRTGTIMGPNSWLAISLQTSPYDSGPNGVYDPPAQSLLSTLFTPIGQNSPDGAPGLGVYRPAFFEGWPFPRVSCDLSFGDYNGYTYNGGCSWSAAAASLEALPGPMAKVSIAVLSVSQQKKGSTGVLLAIHNSGTKDIASIQISDISPLSKHNVKLLAPVLPIRIGKIPPGTFTTVELTFDVPNGVKDLQIKETVTANSGDEGSSQTFTLQQAVLSKK